MDSARDNSLIEALDSIEPVPKPLGVIYMPDPDQISDYPRHVSPDTASSRISLDGSIRSSLSAISQTSLFSDYSYDANRKPTKKILKSSRRPHRRAKKNVRWNLQYGNDSDTTSIDSFDSTSTTSSNLFHRARNGVNETRQNWREFERPPAPGSTGITPSKRCLSRPISAPSLSPLKPLLFVPDLEPTQEYVQPSLYSSLPSHLNNSTNSIACSSSQQDMYSSSPSPQSVAASSCSQNIKFERTVSPLTNALTTVPNKSLSRILTRQQYSDNDRKSSCSGYKNEHKDEVEPGQLNISDDIDIPLILKLNDSSVAELEQSTLEDRQRMHIYKFPESNLPPIVPEVQPIATNPGKTAFLSDNDESDYDHLLPQHVLGRENHGQTSITSMITLRSKQINRINRKKLVSYTDDDIEDALNVIDKDDSERSPPLIPLKRSRILSTPEVEQALMASKTNLQRSGSNPVRGSEVLLTSILNNLPVRKPPPIPPKIKRKTSQEVHQNNSSYNKSIARNRLLDSKDESDEHILPPPPEFASIDCIIDEKLSPKSDDIFNSASTSTLIADQDLSSIGIISSLADKIFSPVYPTPPPADHPIKDRTVVRTNDKQFLTDRMQVSNQRQPMHLSSYISQNNWQTQTKGSTSSTYLPSECDQEKHENLHSPKYKISMETAFNEGNILKDTSFVSTQQYPLDKAKRTRIIHRPAPPPPLLKTNITEDTDVQQLLSNLDIRNDEPQQSQSKLQCTQSNNRSL